MSFTYNIGEEDEQYPNYARRSSFAMPVGGSSKSVIVASRAHQQGEKRLRGWFMQYVGDDPESDWTLYKPGYCIEYPWEHNPETEDNVPDESNDLKDAPWQEPTGSINRFMKRSFILLLDDDRIIRTIERYR